MKFAERVPDYPHDLNAMHEAETVLTEDQRLAYVRELNIRHPTADIDAPDPSTRKGALELRAEVFLLAHAPAKLRAEAFLRVLNLWAP